MSISCNKHCYVLDDDADALLLSAVICITCPTLEAYTHMYARMQFCRHLAASTVN